MFKFVVGLLVVATVLGQICVDIPPDAAIPLVLQPPIGGCNPPCTNLIDKNSGLLNFCLETCTLCDQVDLTQIDQESELFAFQQHIANAIASALESNDYTAVAASAAEAFVSGETQAVVFGFIKAMENGIHCDVVVAALAPVFSEAESIGVGSVLSEEIVNVQTVAECVGKGISKCRGSVQRSCCGTFPSECGCSRGRCRASKNYEKTIPALGLYVYNDIGNRLCKC